MNMLFYYGVLRLKCIFFECGEVLNCFISLMDFYNIVGL